MKNIYKLFLVASFATILGVSCQKEISTNNNVSDEPASPKQLTTITCAFPTMEDENGTKVTLDATGKTGWEVNDEIVIYGLRRTVQSDASTMTSPVIHKLTADEITNPQCAVFKEDLSSLSVDPDGYFPLDAAYPADCWSFYSDYYTSARARFTETNQILMAGGVDTDGTMTLYNLCGAIVFTLPSTCSFDSYLFYGNDETEVVGYEKYLVEVNKSTPNYLAKLGTETYGTLGPKTSISGPVTCDGTTLNYIFVPNEVVFEHGFTIAFTEGGSITKYIKSKKALTLTHGHMVNLGPLPTDKMKDFAHVPESWTSGAIDLSESKTKVANCYVVSTSDAGKVYKIPAVKGNDILQTLNVASVSVLWETWNSAEYVTANSIVEKCDYDKDWIYFKLPASGTIHEGNAVIAAKNASDEIIWSWHIWMPKTAYTTIDAGIHTTAVMSRNLGALVDTEASATEDIDITSLGMFYQWGRKDPFVGPREILKTTDPYPSKARVSGVERTADKIQITIAESIKQPTFFARGYYNGSTQEGPDWTSESNANLWGDSGSKSIYDPCPAGYRVPKRDETKSLWTKGDITAEAGWEYNSDHYWFKLGNPATVFPCVGYIDGGSLKSVYRTIIWNAHSDSYENTYGFSHYAAYCRRIRYESSTLKYDRESKSKSLGAAVRCVVE